MWTIGYWWTLMLYTTSHFSVSGGISNKKYDKPMVAWIPAALGGKTKPLSSPCTMTLEGEVSDGRVKIQAGTSWKNGENMAKIRNKWTHIGKYWESKEKKLTLTHPLAHIWHMSEHCTTLPSWWGKGWLNSSNIKYWATSSLDSYRTRPFHGCFSPCYSRSQKKLENQQSTGGITVCIRIHM